MNVSGSRAEVRSGHQSRHCKGRLCGSAQTSAYDPLRTFGCLDLCCQAAQRIAAGHQACICGVLMLMRLLLLLLLWALPFASANANWGVRNPEITYRISVDGYGLGQSTDDTILVGQVAPSKGQAFWAAERRLNARSPKGDRRVHAWIDGRSCPALEARLAALGETPLKFGTPSDHDGVWMVADGTQIVVEGPGPDGFDGRLPRSGAPLGRVIRIAEHSGPLHAWWSQTEKALEACWRDSPRLPNGIVLKSRMPTDDAAKKQKP